MRLRAVLTLFLGIIIAGSAVAYVRVAMQAPAVVQEMRDVVVADDEIAFGHIIDASMLSLRRWPADSVPRGAFTSLDQVLGVDKEKMRRAKRAISAGDLVLQSKVSDFGERVTITQKIEPGMRAVAIRVNDVTGVAGFVSPSDRVDVTLTRTVHDKMTAATILQNVQVLGIDQASDGAQNKPSVVKTVTVQVRPLDAQKLALAQQAGMLSLSLRHVDAADQPVLDTISVSDLATEEEQQQQLSSTPTPRKLPSIVVNRGGERITVEVPRS